MYLRGVLGLPGIQRLDVVRGRALSPVDKLVVLLVDGFELQRQSRTWTDAVQSTNSRAFLVFRALLSHRVGAGGRRFSLKYLYVNAQSRIIIDFS